MVAFLTKMKAPNYTLGAPFRRPHQARNDAIRLESTVTSLKTIFNQSRTSSSPLVFKQILCTMTRY
ncbi:hypothetical protein GBAR_LOCUS28322 [Geodia barretti]|uniref:Uncharacterized protein n=1 Tax=Geodia barretti TaxID=519541 RepID=A0AA35TNY4_GEOBA|nr:hypothetical protein GBAR_LOCUS28322 [Geodia barretti]